MITKKTITAGATATLLSSEKSRSWYVIQNLSSVAMFVALDGSSDVTVSTGAKPGIKVNPGESLSTDGNAEHRVATDSAIYAVHADASDQTLNIQEA